MNRELYEDLTMNIIFYNYFIINRVIIINDVIFLTQKDLLPVGYFYLNDAKTKCFQMNLYLSHQVT